MNEQANFATKVLTLHQRLASVKMTLPGSYQLVNPYSGEQKHAVDQITAAFYHKYFNDNHKRRLILGSSPARKGTAITGVPFEDAAELQAETGIAVAKFQIKPSSTNFLYGVMQQYGGKRKFYSDFYMSFACPLGLSKISAKGNVINSNYYETNVIKDRLMPFIVASLQEQIKLGVDTSVCYCIGSGENFKVLTSINQTYHFFGSIVPLEHPRYVMQYHFKDRARYIQKYVAALNCK